MKTKIFSIFILVGLLLVPNSFAFGDDDVDGVDVDRPVDRRERVLDAFRERREEAGDILEKNREIFNEKRDELIEHREESLEKFREKREEVAEKLRERVSERLAKSFEKMVENFSRSLEKLNSLSDRIVSHIEKFEEGGKDMTVPRELLLVADQKILDFDLSIQNLEDVIAEQLLNEDLKATRDEIKTAVMETRDSLKEAHGALVEVIRSIRGNLSDDNQDDSDDENDVDEEDDNDDDSNDDENDVDEEDDNDDDSNDDDNQ